MKILVAVVLVLACLIAPHRSHAQEQDEAGGLKTLAVQNRAYSMTHEFSFWLGTLPLDAFTKGLTFSGAYTLHFNDIIAWEIGQFTYSYGIDTDLKADLESLPQPVGPTPFEVVKYYLTTNVVFKPVYGKMATLNRALIYGELFILAGGGYGWMTSTDRPVVDIGVGGRIYAGKYLSFRLDFRDLMFFNTDDLHNELWIALGICLGF